jgi:hypothetical protein
MPDFSAPAYEPYVTLCRELRLERKLQLADAVWSERDGVDYWFSMQTGRPNVHYTWLPQLTDWLDMLEAAGCPNIAFMRGDGYCKCAVLELHRVDDVVVEASLSDIETAATDVEAAGRLWIAVTA